MAKGIRDVAALPDPVGAVLSRVERPNGLVIEKTAVPMGVIAIIYESRPNVTSDAAALALKAGLRLCAPLREGGPPLRRGHRRRPDAGASPRPDCPGGPVSGGGHHPGHRAHELMTASGMRGPAHPPGGRGADPGLCGQCHRPRASRRAPASVTSMWTRAADLDMALDILENAKCSRPSVCNAAEVCLVHRDGGPGLSAQDAGAAERMTRASPGGSGRWSCAWTGRRPGSSPARPRVREDFDTEFLDYILAVRRGGRRRRRPSATSQPHSTGHSRRPS